MIMTQAAWLAAGGLIALFTILTTVTGAEPDGSGGLARVLADGAAVEKCAGGFRFTEGPLYEKKTGIVYFSDQPTDTLHAYDTKTGKASVFRHPTGVPNGNTFDKDGRLVGCEHQTRRVSRTEKSGEIVTLAYEFEGKRLNSPNDIVIKSDGAIYFTDPPYGIKKEQEELGFYGVFRIARDGSLTALARDFVKPNGLAFSPDESKLYVDDTDEKHIRVFDVQGDGTLANGRVFATLPPNGKEGAPDGMKVDKTGRVFCTGPGGVWVFAPSGAHIGTIETPEAPANVAFGDKDGKTLYITARTSLYKVRLREAGPIPPVRK